MCSHLCFYLCDCSYHACPISYWAVPLCFSPGFQVTSKLRLFELFTDYDFGELVIRLRVTVSVKRKNCWPIRVMFKFLFSFCSNWKYVDWFGIVGNYWKFEWKVCFIPSNRWNPIFNNSERNLKHNVTERSGRPLFMHIRWISGGHWKIPH